MQQNYSTSVRRTNFHITSTQKSGFDLLNGSKRRVCRRTNRRGIHPPGYSSKREHAELRSSNGHCRTANKLTTVVFVFIHQVLLLQLRCFKTSRATGEGSRVRD